MKNRILLIEPHTISLSCLLALHCLLSSSSTCFGQTNPQLANRPQKIPKPKIELGYMSKPVYLPSALRKRLLDVLENQRKKARNSGDITFYYHPVECSINDSGKSVFLVVWREHPIYTYDHMGIFTEDRKIVEIGDTISGGRIIASLSHIQINNKGNIAYIAEVVSPSTWKRAIANNYSNFHSVNSFRTSSTSNDYVLCIDNKVVIDMDVVANRLLKKDRADKLSAGGKVDNFDPFAENKRFDVHRSLMRFKLGDNGKPYFLEVFQGGKFRGYGSHEKVELPIEKSIDLDGKQYTLSSGDAPKNLGLQEINEVNNEENPEVKSINAVYIKFNYSNDLSRWNTIWSINNIPANVHRSEVLTAQDVLNNENFVATLGGKSVKEISKKPLYKANGDIAFVVPEKGYNLPFPWRQGMQYAGPIAYDAVRETINLQKNSFLREFYKKQIQLYPSEQERYIWLNAQGFPVFMSMGIFGGNSFSGDLWGPEGLITAPSHDDWYDPESKTYFSPCPWPSARYADPYNNVYPCPQINKKGQILFLSNGGGQNWDGGVAAILATPKKNIVLQDDPFSDVLNDDFKNELGSLK